MADVRVTLAAPAERPVIENLLQLYIHDFSGLLAPERPEGDLGDDGRFPAYPLDAYWRGDGHIPLLVRTAGRLAGFALIDLTSHSGRSVDRNMAEFFIARRHRRAGVGTAAAHAIFSRWPGQWEAAVARSNLPVLGFWRNAAASHPRAEDLEEIGPTGVAWTGPILRFRIQPE